MKISQAQMRKIYATARKNLNWSNEMLHLFLQSQTGKEHIRNLDKHEAMRFINELVKIAGEQSSYRASEQDRILKEEGMLLGCTPAQCDKIRYMMEEVGWTNGRLKDELEKYGAERLEDLTRTLAGNLIEYLKSLRKRQEVA